MNANKLADKLEQGYWEGGTREQAAAMLRQQQAEIKALKKLKANTDAIDKKLFESIKKSNEMWDKAANSILKKAKKNEYSN